MYKNSEIERIYSSQVKNKVNFAALSVEKRKEKLNKLLKEIIAEKENILAALNIDLGKSFTESQLIEIYPIVKELKHTISHLKKWVKPERVGTPITLIGSRSKIIKDAKGMVLIISPWNYPFLLAVNPVIHAVAAGNCVILKPSGKSINTSLILKNLFAKVFAEDEVAVILGDHKDAQTLLDLKFDHIFFTGSTSVGKMVMEAAAKYLTPVTLELGGKSPAIVDGTYDIELTAKRIVWGKFINAGQTCIAPDYLLVKNSVEEKLIELIKKYSIKYYEANEGFIQSEIYPRMINEQHAEKLGRLMDNEKSAGSKVDFGGEINSRNKYVEPTIFRNVKPGNPIMSEEIFGPILPVITFDDEKEAVRIINQNANPLAMYVFSRNKNFVNGIIKSCPSGGVTVNNTIVHFANVNLPFGGIGNSGIGKSHGRAGFNEFVNHRAVLSQSKFALVSLLYPPYNIWKKRLADIVLKYF